MSDVERLMREIEVLRASPGDVLVLRLQGVVPAEQFRAIRDYLAKACEEVGIKAVLLDGEIEVAAVLRQPDPASWEKGEVEVPVVLNSERPPYPTVQR